jgi:GWxTD domain-containing protein
MNLARYLRPLVFVAVGATLASCGKWQRVGTEEAPDPGQFVPRLFDETEVYREMDLIAADGPIPFVGGIRFLAGPTSDSTLGVVALSITTNVLSFERVGDAFEARYRVELAFRKAAEVVLRSTHDEAVRVATFAETQHREEVLIFQHFVHVPPGSMHLNVMVRDRNATTFSQAEVPITVPGYGQGRWLSSLVPVYHAATRVDRSAIPELAVNPEAATPYGMDTLRLYVEAYGLSEGGTIVFRAVPREGLRDEAWRDSVSLEPGALLRGFVMLVETEKLPIGELFVEAFISGTGDTVRTTALVTFSEQWAIAHFDETLSLLRYFGAEQAIQEMREAVPENRLALWRAFWRATDPEPLTPGNEAFDLYFQRVQEANERFRERDTPGWLTDRGEVFVTIGAPDEIWDSSSDLEGGGRYIRWTYTSARAMLEFVDGTGYGRFRLTSLSRSDFMRVVNRMRRSG